jgi:hypothetical protein
MTLEAACGYPHAAQVTFLSRGEAKIKFAAFAAKPPKAKSSIFTAAWIKSSGGRKRFENHLVTFR